MQNRPTNSADLLRDLGLFNDLCRNPLVKQETFGSLILLCP